MDESVLVEVYISAAQLYVDVELPVASTIKAINKVLFIMLSNYTHGVFIPNECSLLYNQRLQLPLHEDSILAQTGIRYGDRLIVL